MNETQAPLADTASVDSPDISSQPIAPSHPALLSATTPDDRLRLRIFSIVMIALFACLAVFHGWRPGYLLAPTDALQLTAPFATPGSNYVARNEQLLDQTVQFVPWMIYTIDRYKQHQIPLWNPYSQLGVPFMANGQSAIFYPTILLHLTLPETWSWTLSAALRLFFAGLGMYLLAGRYGLRRLPRLLTALTFMLCGFNIVWLNHPQMNVMPFLPWAVLLTEMLIQRVTLLRVLGASVIFFIQFLGGHPASCIHLLLTCALIWILRLLIPQKGRAADAGRLSAIGPMLASGLALFAAVAFGFALAAAQWLPLIEYANHSGATIVRHDNLQNAPTIGTNPSYLVGMLFPYASGFPDGVAPFEFRQVTHLPNTNELAPAFIGTIPFILALFAAITLRRQRIVRIWTIMALIAAAIAIKIPGVDHIVRLIPGLNVAQNARLLVVTAFALSILAGVGLDSLMVLLRQGIDPVRLRKILARTAIAVAAIAIIATITLIAAKGPILRHGEARAIAEYNTSAVHEHSLEYVKALVHRVHTELLFTSLRLFIPAFFLGLAALMLWRHHRRGGNSIACCAWPWCVLAVIDLLAFAIPYNPGAPIATNFPANVATIQKLQELPAYRIAGAFNTFRPETSTAYNLSDLRGYDALAPERYYRWWAHPGIGDLPPEAQGYLSKLENPEHPAWQLLNFGYFLTAPDQPAPDGPFKLIDSAEDANIYQLTTIRPRAWVAARAEVSETAQAVLDRIANMEKTPFNPDEVVLLDKEVSADAERVIAPADNEAERAKQDKAFWSNLKPGSTSARPTIQILPPPTKNDEERPEIIRLRVNNASGGFLVLADTYFPGWTATVFDGSGAGREVPILPAYGVLRAVQLPAGSSSVRVEFQYRPWSWRIGVMISLISLCLLAILIGFTLFRTTFFVPRAGSV